jgi:hypothetical protein
LSLLHQVRISACNAKYSQWPCITLSIEFCYCSVTLSQRQTDPLPPSPSPPLPRLRRPPVGVYFQRPLLLHLPARTADCRDRRGRPDVDQRSFQGAAGCGK